MDDLLARLDQLQQEAEADLSNLSEAQKVEQFRIKYLGKKARASISKQYKVKVKQNLSGRISLTIQDLFL